MTDELVRQIVLQAPSVAILVYLLIRLDQRLAEMTKVLCDLIAEEKPKRGRPLHDTQRSS